ncbi:MAG: NAD-glutamate dehydrogenase domain-containing protein, partial [Alphaproteobacteria bacterium]
MSAAALATPVAQPALDPALHKMASACTGAAPVVKVSQGATGHTTVQVVLPDQPFLYDTVLLHLQRQGLYPHVAQHPVVEVKGRKLSCMSLAIDRQPVASHAGLEKMLTHALHQAQLAGRDFMTMKNNMVQVAATTPDAATRSFLDWLLADHFIFLGYRHYDVTHPTKGEPMVQASKQGALGVLAERDSTLAQPTPFSKIPENLQVYLQAKGALTIAKTMEKSNIHRDVDMDYIGVRTRDAQGRVVGEHRFIGLLTSKAYTAPVHSIPLVAEKLAAVLSSVAKHYAPNSHHYKAMAAVLSMFPRDELLTISPADLERMAYGIVDAQERSLVRTFVRYTPAENRAYVQVHLPLERMNSGLRLKIQDILMEAFEAESLDFHVQMGEGTLAHLRFTLRTTAQSPRNVAEDALAARILAAATGWLDDVRTAIVSRAGAEQGVLLFNRYQAMFTPSYQEHTVPTLAAQDMLQLEAIGAQAAPTVRFTFRNREADGAPRLRVFAPTNPVALSHLMPLFTNMGLLVVAEQTYPLHDAAQRNIWLQDFELAPHAALDCTRADTLVETLTATWEGRLENDRLAALVLSAGLDMAALTTLRLLAATVRQMDRRLAKDDVHGALLQHPALVTALMQLFTAQFDPSLGAATSATRTAKMATADAAFVEGMKNVTVLEDDRILRKVHALLHASVRTNAWQRADATAPLAIKFDSSQIPNLPKPVPFREIFVYHAAFEGCHLRGGPIARGGLRWSERPADYRTEVLGLMKAQITKNTIIVPVGAKGGFVVRDLPKGDRKTVMLAVENTYRIFVTTMLSLADNMVAGNVVPPVHVVRHDADDAYFVVAADKGTATFSNTANDISLNAQFWGDKMKGFWLGDAFASGGSQGYDHKGMGITSRGAWESVKHHFRAMGKDPSKETFTCVGIGDMSGDVFGNGLLRSPHTQLLAAFNHQHIFVDPNPDCKASFAERQRLFTTPLTTWADYNVKLLSKGGKIYERKAKSVQLTQEIRARFGIEAESLTPDELIRALLMAEVDLLWNGGIGTYIKASFETHADAADKANDELRVDASQVRAKVIAEGGNLGITQPARIELARQGVRLNTDFIDNAGGVHTSDREVNIKILLKLAEEKGKLKPAARNKLLASMTDAIANQVLDENRLQADAIAIEENKGAANLHGCWQLQHALVAKGVLDAPLEFLPTVAEVQRRQAAGEGYTRPELAVLLSYAKADVYADLLSSTVPAEPALEPFLVSYFPEQLQQFAPLMPIHALKDALVATQLTNQVVNRMGPCFINNLRADLGASTATIVMAFHIALHLT